MSKLLRVYNFPDTVLWSSDDLRRISPSFYSLNLFW